MLALEIALRSEQGGREYNEDACGHWHSDSQLCCVLADGAGGHGGGDVAARTAVGHVLQGFAADPTHDGQALGERLRQASHAIVNGRVAGSSTAHMHSTAVCLVVDFAEHRAHWAHSGDSRLYWIRNGQVHLRTRDHSLVQSLVEAGMLTETQLRIHPKRSQLSSALGTEDDSLLVAHSGSPATVAPGDAFLLCTDGLWEHIDDGDIARSCEQAASPQAWLDDLMQCVQQVVASQPKHDNFSAVAIWAHTAG